MFRFDSAILRILILGIFLSPTGKLVAQPHPPNILLILADDVGREVLGCYGGTSYETPHLDRLAAQGMKFDRFFVCPVCHPSRTTLLTGRYPSSLGSPEWGTFPEPAASSTVAQVLRNAGYTTAVAGKWQLALLGKDLDHPHRLGFDEYCLFGWHEGPRYFQPLIWQNGERRENVSERFGPDVYAEFLIDFMERNKDRPFFAFSSLALCHDVSDDFKPVPPHGPNGRYLTFAEMVAEMDRVVGRLLDAVERLGLEENTLVFFTTDNGSPVKSKIRHDGEEFEYEQIVSEWKGSAVPGAKGKLTDWGTCVPTFARWTGVIPQEATDDHLIDISDILPTFAELTGAALPEVSLDGQSFAGLLTGQDYQPRQWVISETGPKHFVRTDKWKLLHDGTLFNLRADPGEERPILPEQDSEDSKAARKELGLILKEKGIGNP
jgi:arylsulfatase A